jgi:uncharacterized protein (PEP-CTERM system associated)
MKTRRKTGLGVRMGAVLGCSALSLSMGAGAQEDQGFIPLEPLEGPPPRVWFEPRVTMGLSVRNTGSRNSPRTRIEERMAFSPGISGVLNTPRIQGFLDYELTSAVYPQNEKKGRISHLLETQASVNAWDNRAFVDLGASVRQRAISLFDDPGYRRSSEQTAESTFLQVSPYLVGRLGGLADYQLRYSAQGINMGSDELPGMQVQTASARIASPRSGAPVGWLLESDAQAVDHELGRDTRSDSARAGLVFRPTDEIALTLTRGYENNDILTLQRQRYDTRGVQLDWRPGQRTRLSAGAQDRYFGRGHDLSLQHRTGRTVWRYTDTRGVSNSGLQANAAPPLRLSEFLGQRLRSNHPDWDEGRLNQAVDALLQLEQLNPYADALLFPTFLSSTATLQRSQSLSVSLSGVRSRLTLAYLRNDMRRLPAPLGDIAAVVDDFRTNTTVQQKGWTANLSHRLTPVMTGNLGVSQRNSVGDVDSRRTRALNLGVATRLSPRTDASVQVNFARHSGNFRPYRDTGMSAQVVYRF